jgi:mannose-6-phosphate isomerase-like protein (cupin superfamily)
MVPRSRMFLCAFVIAGAAIGGFVLSQSPEPEGRVTNIFHDVQLLPAQSDARAAAINDKVDEGTALRTGGDSRSELTFADLTITRLGENTIYSFNRAGRSLRLDSGSILLYARKNSGGAEISTKAVSVGITGTTLIFESRPDSYDRLIVLEGDARFSLNDFPDQSTEVHAGQLLNVRAGSKKLPKPGRVDLRRIVKTHPLIKNFPPLPSLDLILAAADGRNPNRAPPQPQPPISGTGSQGGPPPVYVPNPTGPPPRSGYPVNSVPTATPPHRPTPSPTARPTPHRPRPKPTAAPKKNSPPRRLPVRPTATPKPTPPRIY